MGRKRSFFTVLKSSAKCFAEDNAFKLSASLSYYTVFSLGPLLLIIISLAGFFYGKEAVQGQLNRQISDLVGAQAAQQIQQIIINIQQSGEGPVAAIIGIIVLIIGATGVFIEMQDSINYIWSVKAKPQKGWLKFLMNRLLSFSLIVSMGFILLVSLVVSAMVDILNQQLTRYFAEATVYLIYVLNIAVVLLVISALFMVIYKILPDATIRWKDAFAGALFTSVLFLLGKFAIGFYLGRANLSVTYGAAASIVVILTWVYYSSLIMYFGAEFTKMNALMRGGGIRPSSTSVFIIKKEVRELPDNYRHPEEVNR
jgi:membrane protein